MKSWDFFDTLLGRSTGREPWLLFDALAGPEWRIARQHAERTAAAPTLEAFWRKLAEDGQTRGLCSGHEWQLECDAAFPIVENVRQVQPGDMIVSDTYFTEGQIRHLATLIGIPEGVRIVATPAGKWERTVWQDLPKPERHTGDNRLADFTGPRQFGIETEHYRHCEWSVFERQVVRDGFPEAAAAMRTARLQCPYGPKSPEREAWMAQANGNIGFLWMAAAAVREYVGDRWKRVLFVSRDGLQLRRVFSTLYPDVETGVLWASRQTLTEPDDRFTRYVRGEVTDGTLVVDIHGSGNSVNLFTKATGFSPPWLFVVAVARCPRFGLMHAPYLTESASGIAGSRIEVCNYDVEGRVVGVTDDGQPIRAPVEYDTAAVRVAHAAVASALRYAVRPCRAPTQRELRLMAQRAGQLAPRPLVRQHQPVHTFEPVECRTV